MAFGDYSGPDKPNKGHEGGACNRQRCQDEPALWHNWGTSRWYCEDCARDIGQDSFNLRDWKANYEPRLGHPMFETRKMLDAREVRDKTPDGLIEKFTAPYFALPRGRDKPQSGSLKRLLAKAEVRP